MRGGLHRAAKIRTAKLDAMAEGRPYKPTKRRRRRQAKWERMLERDQHPPASATTTPTPAPPAPPMGPMGPGLDAQDEARQLARERGGFQVDLWRLFRERGRELIDV